MPKKTLHPPASITIPDEHVAGFTKIISLSPEESRLVADALEKAKSVSARDLTALVIENLPSLAAKDARDIVQTLLSLYSVRASVDTQVDPFVKDLIVAAKQAEIPMPEITDTISESLMALLSVKTLSMISKARGIHTDHENTFCSVRVLTDLRPVFDADVKDEPAGFVIAHMLKLGFHHCGKHTTIHVAMDKVDIDMMIAALQRAKEKANTLASVIKGKAGFTILAD
jgi:hypothetical protein